MNLFIKVILLILLVSNACSFRYEFIGKNETEIVNRSVESFLDEEVQETSCEQHNGLQGICRPTRTCLRQQPTQKRWHSCEWEDKESMPSMVCCFSEGQFTDYLLNETNDDQGIQVFDDEEDDKDSDEQQKCGISKIVSKVIPTLKHRRSKEMLEVYDMLFPSTYRIVMGNSVKVGQIPWMVSIYNQEQFVCGGTIIDERHILTAAHCFEENRNPGVYHVRTGSVFLFNGTALRVDRIFVHEKYTLPRIYHDIAIVRCKNKISFSDEVSPVCLPRLNWINKKKLVGKIVFVTGFGDLSFGGTQASSLQQTDLTILNNSFCENNYNNLIDNRMRFPVGMKGSVICAGHVQGGKDACQGDSGGPLTLHLDGVSYLIGIVSFGFKCAMARFPGVYTFVTYYLNWIRQKIISV